MVEVRVQEGWGVYIKQEDGFEMCLTLNEAAELLGKLKPAMVQLINEAIEAVK